MNPMKDSLPNMDEVVREGEEALKALEEAKKNDFVIPADHLRKALERERLLIEEREQFIQTLAIKDDTIATIEKGYFYQLAKVAEQDKEIQRYKRHAEAEIDEELGTITVPDGAELLIVPRQLDITVEEFFDGDMPDWLIQLIEENKQLKAAVDSWYQETQSESLRADTAESKIAEQDKEITPHKVALEIAKECLFSIKEHSSDYDSSAAAIEAIRKINSQF
jgi:hypothetical protein